MSYLFLRIALTVCDDKPDVRDPELPSVIQADIISKIPIPDGHEGPAGASLLLLLADFLAAFSAASPPVPAGLYIYIYICIYII